MNYDADGDGAVTAEEEAVASEKLSKLRPREVSVEEARRWAESRNLTFFETSAVPPGAAGRPISSGAPRRSILPMSGN